MLKKKVSLFVLAAVSVMSVSAFAASVPVFSENGSYKAAPAFNTPAEALRHYAEENARSARDNAHRPPVFSENGSYEAVPAFDTPAEALRHYAEENARSARDNAHRPPVFSENGDY